MKSFLLYIGSNIWLLAGFYLFFLIIPGMIFVRRSYNHVSVEKRPAFARKMSLIGLTIATISIIFISK